MVIEPLLIDEDYYARVEGREIISNLAKVIDHFFLLLLFQIFTYHFSTKEIYKAVYIAKNKLFPVPKGLSLV